MRGKSGAFGAVLGEFPKKRELGSLDWLAFRAKGGAYGAAKVGGRAPVRCSGRFASQERRLRRRVRGGYMSSGISSLCEPRPGAFGAIVPYRYWYRYRFQVIQK